MRVLLVNAHGADLGHGGAEKYVGELAAGLRRAGDTVDLLSAFPSRNGSAESSTTLHSTDWRDDPLRRIRNHLGDVISHPTARLHDAISASRPDVVHTNNLPGVTTAIWEACRRLGVPVVHTLHDYYLLCPRVTLQRRDGQPCCSQAAFCRLRRARLVRWSDALCALIAISDHVRRRHERLLGAATFHVVRHPVAPLTVEPLPPPRTPPETIGYLGTLSRPKGTMHLVEAAPQLAELGYSVQVAGNGPLRGLVEGSGARGELRYAGFVQGDERLRFIEATDLAVLPSTWEEPGGPPYAVAEWLAARRPVLVTEHGGLREVADLMAGAVATAADAEAIVTAARALREPTRWSDLIASIPVADETALASWVERHREIYEAAIAAPGRPSSSSWSRGRRPTAARARYPT
jgi:glycosyltransferase involved in cell wall biosynthesis